MKKIYKIMIMKNLKRTLSYSLYALLVVVTTTSCESDFREAAERCYYEGQRDALQGNVRIKLNKDSTHIWISSPWRDGKTHEFNPSYIDTKTHHDY